MRSERFAWCRDQNLAWTAQDVFAGVGLGASVASIAGQTFTVPHVTHVHHGPPTTLTVKTLPGQLITDYEEHADRIAASLDVALVRFTPAGRSVLHMELLSEDPLEAVVPLPSEAELVEDFGVSRLTVRRGLAVLQNEGLVETVRERRWYEHAFAPGSTWWRGLPSLGLTIGFGLIVTAGVGSAISVPDPPWVGTVPAVQTPTSAVPAVPALKNPVQLAPTVMTGEVPQRLALPSLQADARILPVGVLPGRGLAVPDNPQVLGWWQGGARPGSGQGTVVIDGHVDTAADGPGALFDLRKLRPGDPVAISTDRGLRSYVVVALRSYPKADLPPEIFARSGQPRLVIITCGGVFDKSARQYADNIVAYAVPTNAALPE